VKCYPQDDVLAQLEETAFQALSTLTDRQPYALSPPIAVEILFRLPKLADNLALFPGYHKTGRRTVTYNAKDSLEAFRAFTAVPAIFPEFSAQFFRQMLRKVKNAYNIDLKPIQAEVDKEIESKNIPLPPVKF
jgi:hypothetical protein